MENDTIAIDMDEEMRDAINCAKHSYQDGTYTVAEMLEIGMDAVGKYCRECTPLEIVASLSSYEDNGIYMEIFLPKTQECIDFWKSNNFVDEPGYSDY